MTIDLSGKSALVTGSSSGIGRAIALSLGNAGARVAIHYRLNSGGAEQTARQLRQSGAPEPVILQGDVSKPDELAKCFSQFDDQLGPLDIFINNAGIDGEKENLQDGNFKGVEKVISINLLGGIRGIQAALTRMVPRGTGVIISITSVHQSIPWAGQAAYCASKAGIAEITRSVALELGDCGVRILNLAPGATKTDINKDVWNEPDALQDLLKKIPQGRLGTSEEIGNLAAFLSSDLASYVHGTTIYADGAMTAYPSFAKGG